MLTLPSDSEAEKPLLVRIKIQHNRYDGREADGRTCVMQTILHICLHSDVINYSVYKIKFITTIQTMQITSLLITHIQFDPKQTQLHVSV